MKAYVFLDPALRPQGKDYLPPMDRVGTVYEACKEWIISPYGSRCLSVSPLLLVAWRQWRGYSTKPRYLAAVALDLPEQAFARTPSGVYTVSRARVWSIKDLSGYDSELAELRSADDADEEPSEVQENFLNLFGSPLL